MHSLDTSDIQSLESIMHTWLMARYPRFQLSEVLVTITEDPVPRAAVLDDAEDFQWLRKTNGLGLEITFLGGAVGSTPAGLMVRSATFRISTVDVMDPFSQRVDEMEETIAELRRTPKGWRIFQLLTDAQRSEIRTMRSRFQGRP